MLSFLSCLLLLLGLLLSASCEEQPKSEISVMGIVYCDICSNNSFSRHSYFLPEIWVFRGTLSLKRSTLTVEIDGSSSPNRFITFLKRVEVNLQCQFKTNSLTTKEVISFSSQRLTNRFGIYKIDIPNLEGIKCADDNFSVISICNATLLSSSAKSCNIPGYTTTSDLVSFKSKQNNLCIYSLSALNFRPAKRDHNLCGH